MQDAVALPQTTNWQAVVRQFGACTHFGNPVGIVHHQQQHGLIFEMESELECLVPQWIVAVVRCVDHINQEQSIAIQSLDQNVIGEGNIHLDEVLNSLQSDGMPITVNITNGSTIEFELR